MSIAALPRPSRLALSCFLTALACVFSSLPSEAWAQWAWRDANGRITASDRPPPRDVADKDIVSRPKSDKRQALNQASTAPAAGAASAPAGGAPTAPTAAASAPGAKTPLEREVEARKAKAEKEQADKKAAEEAKLAAQRADNCKRARSYQATLDSGVRIARTASNGEREIMDDAGRAAETRKTREVIASDCR
jgi:type IV secretory pathway VirB10-like protein